MVCLLSAHMLSAQSYQGLLTDNYSGVHGVLSNPANIADSRLKLDVNLIGVSALYGNNYIGFNFSDVFSDYNSTFDTSKTFPKTDNFLSFNIDILGPSVMLSINEKSSLAIFTRGRSLFNVDNVNGNTLEKEGGFDETEDFSVVEGNISGSFSVWGEIGATYARVLSFVEGKRQTGHFHSHRVLYLYGRRITVYVHPFQILYGHRVHTGDHHLFLGSCL